MGRIYLDHHATTPCDPRVVAAMLPFFTETFGNAASRTHAYGWEAEAAVETARAQVAALVGAEPREVVWTSGATEANNLALKGLVAARGASGAHLVTCATEHASVLDVCRALEHDGVAVTVVGVDRLGRVDPVSVREACTPATVAISVMAANNEIGTLQPIAELAAVARARGIPLHVDAAQAVGRVPVDMHALDVDLLTCSAHKLYGPKGVGALIVRRRTPRLKLAPLLHGGGHERGLRAGTLPVPLIVGFGAACAIAQREMTAEAARLRTLRDRLFTGLTRALDHLTLNGDPDHRLPGNLNVSFGHVHGEGLLLALPGIALSSGSACTSATIEPSHVLRAIGLPDALAHAAVRFGLGRGTTEAEVDTTITAVVAAVRKLRAESATYADARTTAGAGVP